MRSYGTVPVMLDLGTLGGTSSGGAAVNASGQVTGSSYTTIPGVYSVVYHAFRWDGGVMQDLGTLGGSFSFGSAISDSGQVTGAADTPDGASHAFLWDGAVMKDLGTLGGSIYGAAINALGQVTGLPIDHCRRISRRISCVSLGWRRDAGSRGAWQHDSFGARHQRIGTGDGGILRASDGERHAFLWDGAVMQDLGTLGGTDSFGVVINDSGQVTGTAEHDWLFPHVRSHAFLWDGAVMQDLGALGG